MGCSNSKGVIMKKVTTILISVVLVGLLIYDVFAIAKGGTEASISSVIINFSYKMPVFTFLCGIVCGHLFWRMKKNEDTKVIDDAKDI
jgi:hypothetical protein